MKQIPLNSLTLVFSKNEKTIENVSNMFDPSNIFNMEKIKDVLVGRSNRPFYENFFQDYLVSAIEHKIKLGERVCITDFFEDQVDRLILCRLASYYDIPLFFVFSESEIDGMSHHDDIRQIKQGDFVAETIDLDKNDMSLVTQVDKMNLAKEVKQRGFSGITLIPDIHGMKETMLAATSWAQQQNNFIVFMGDLIDYGPKSISCVEIAYDLVIRGKAILIIGNHEVKIFKWLQNNKFRKQHKIKLYDSNLKTIEKLESLNDKDLEKFTNKLLTLFTHGSYHARISDEVAIAHAAYSDSLFKDKTYYPRNDKEKLLIHGQQDFSKLKEGMPPSQKYDWVNDLTGRTTVFVGHDIRNINHPVVDENQRGSRVYFLDTGCGKNGPLTSADIDIETLEVKNFNQH